MISFEEAYDIVLKNHCDFGTEMIPLLKSQGRILRENWRADRDFPPFDRVMMDGIAIKSSSTITQGSELEIESISRAGFPQKTLDNPLSGCVEVMTGAMMPKGADSVIRYEDVSITQGIAKINIDTIRKGQNVHAKGLDISQEDTLIKGGKIINAAEIGIGASIGQDKVRVSRLPRTAIVSTGDELVEINEEPLDFQIRKSNVFQIASILSEYGIEADTFHINDDTKLVSDSLESLISTYELIILSGGVSKGAFDFIPTSLSDLGVQKHFHRVKQRPGKPLWFGTHRNGTTVFALPGNPVSSFMCTQVYIKSWLNKCLEWDNDRGRFAKLDTQVIFKPDLTYFLEVNVMTNSAGETIAIPTKGNGSGDLANLSRANAFALLPRGKEIFEKNEVFRIWPF